MDSFPERPHLRIKEVLWMDLINRFNRRLVMKGLKSILVLGMMVLVFGFSASLAFAQVASKADSVKSSEQTAGKININKATSDQLMEIKGIGSSYAKRIVEYREKNGPFKKIEDIMQVQGIGTKIFESIKDKITI
jgi:comEA protein